jgi:hypothetical protein
MVPLLLLNAKLDIKQPEVLLIQLLIVSCTNFIASSIVQHGAAYTRKTASTKYVPGLKQTFILQRHFIYSYGHTTHSVGFVCDSLYKSQNVYFRVQISLIY